LISDFDKYLLNKDSPANFNIRLGDIVQDMHNGFFKGNPTWNDLNFEGTALSTGNSAPDLISLFGSGGIIGRGFDGGNTTEQLFGGSEILHDYKEGTDIHFHLHWMPTTTGLGNVKWQLEYTWQNIDGTFSTPETLELISAAGGTAWKHNKGEFEPINGTGMKIGSHILFRIFRIPTDEQDTYSADAALLSVGIHYQINSTGSSEIYKK